MSSSRMSSHRANSVSEAEQRPWGPPRVRISRACDRCKKRKIRCSGTKPCDTCERAATTCAYAAPYHRGRRPPPVAPAQQRNAWPSHDERDVHLPGAPGLLDEANRHSEPAEVSDEAGRAPTGDLPSRASPGTVTDLQGHYIGPASGVSFLARVQGRLQQSRHASSNFTFGDVPLPDFDPIPSVMVSSEETVRLVDRFFNFTMPIDRFFHRPTVEEWRREFCETMGSMKSGDDGPARRAALWMIFAMAQEHMAEDPNTVDDDRRFVA